MPCPDSGSRGLRCTETRRPRPPRVRHAGPPGVRRDACRILARSTMITVEDVIQLALPAGTTVAAGRAGLGREVTWATRIRSSPPAFGHLTGGELVLLPVSILSELDERLGLDEAIPRLAELGVAAAA